MLHLCISVFELFNTYMKMDVFTLFHTYLKMDLFTLFNTSLQMDVFTLFNTYLKMDVFTLFHTYLKMEVFTLFNTYLKMDVFTLFNTYRRWKFLPWVNTLPCCCSKICVTWSTLTINVCPCFQLTMATFTDSYFSFWNIYDSTSFKKFWQWSAHSHCPKNEFFH